MSLRTPLGRVRGLGSAKSGTHHWWWQRLTAIALVPLTIWFVIVVISYSNADYETVVALVSHPVATVALLALVVSIFYHAQLGVQVVIEDYLHIEWAKLVVLISVRFGLITLALAAAVSIVRISLGSS